MLLPWATAGCLQGATASWLIQNMDITSAVISLTLIYCHSSSLYSSSANPKYPSEESSARVMCSA